MSEATKKQTKELAAAMAETLLRNLAIVIDEASGKIDVMRGGQIRHERGVPVRDMEDMLRAAANNLAMMGYEAASALFDEAMAAGAEQERARTKEAQDKLHAAAEALAKIANDDMLTLNDHGQIEGIETARAVAKETLTKLGY